MSDSFCEINWKESKYKTTPGVSYPCVCCHSLPLDIVLFNSVISVLVGLGRCCRLRLHLRDSHSPCRYCLRFDRVCSIPQSTSLARRLSIQYHMIRIAHKKGLPPKNNWKIIIYHHRRRHCPSPFLQIESIIAPPYRWAEVSIFVVVTVLRPFG